MMKGKDGLWRTAGGVVVSNEQARRLDAASEPTPAPKPMVRQTRTYAELDLSPAAYDEIKDRLTAAGYQHAFMDDGTIDMHGIGVTRNGEPTAEVP